MRRRSFSPPHNSHSRYPFLAEWAIFASHSIFASNRYPLRRTMEWISHRMRTKRAYIDIEDDIEFLIREIYRLFFRYHQQREYYPYLFLANGRYPLRQKKGSRALPDKKNALRELTIEFAVAVSDACEEIKGVSIYVNQLVRASSSIGANIHEARYAQSRADFISKLEIALKETSETEYWLELIYRKHKFTEEQYRTLRNMCGTIHRMLIASVTTAKANRV